MSVRCVMDAEPSDCLSTTTLRSCSYCREAPAGIAPEPSAGLRAWSPNEVPVLRGLAAVGSKEAVRLSRIRLGAVSVRSLPPLAALPRRSRRYSGRACAGREGPLSASLGKRAPGVLSALPPVTVQLHDAFCAGDSSHLTTADDRVAPGGRLTWYPASRTPALRVLPVRGEHRATLAPARREARVPRGSYPSGTVLVGSGWRAPSVSSACPAPHART